MSEYKPTDDERIRVLVQNMRNDLLHTVGDLNDILINKQYEHEHRLRAILNRTAKALSRAMSARIEASTINNNREV